MENESTIQDTPVQGKQVKRIDFNENKFEANGKVYHIETGIATGRFMEYEVYQLELMASMSISKLYEKQNVLYQLLNQCRFADAAVVLNEIRSNTVKKSEKEPTVLKICALFINTEDEDRTVFNNDLVVRKIDDWKKEGIDIRDFFTLAFNLVPGFIEIYNKLTRDITEALNPLGVDKVKDGNA